MTEVTHNDLSALGCPVWSLPTPDGGDKACSADVQGQDASGYACNVACPAGANGRDFVIDPSLFICVYGGTWLPNNWVPDCTGQWHMAYILSMADL